MNFTGVLIGGIAVAYALVELLPAALIGIAFIHKRSLSDGVHWSQLWTVLEGLSLSPLLGFALTSYPAWPAVWPD